MTWVEPTAWYAQLPPCYVAAGMLITDHDGRILLVKPHYRHEWGLPGGVADLGEAPHLACEREIKEELGLTVTAGPLLAVDFVPADERRLRSMVYFLFDGGQIQADTPITVQEDEIDSYAFLPPDVAEERMGDVSWRRVNLAFMARATGQPVYAPSA